MDKKELRKLSEEGKLIFGVNQVSDAAREGTASKIILASNAPDQDVEAVKRYAEISGVEVEVEENKNDQLGVICRKPFPVSFLAVKK